MAEKLQNGKNSVTIVLHANGHAYPHHFLSFYQFSSVTENHGIYGRYMA
jgi:hypothetical protein